MKVTLTEATMRSIFHRRRQARCRAGEVSHLPTFVPFLLTDGRWRRGLCASAKAVPLLLVNGGGGGTLHEFDRGGAITFVLITFAAVGDFPAIGRFKGPAPFAADVFIESVVYNIVLAGS